MKPILKAEEFLERVMDRHVFAIEEAPITVATEAMIEFAKLHVEAALKEASEKAKCPEDAIIDLGNTIIEAYVEKDSILNAYPLSNIK